MNKGRKITIAIAAPMLLWAFSIGPDPYSDGGPGGNAAACAQAGCHTGTAVNPAGGQVQLQFPGGLTYTPGVKQRIKVVISDSNHASRRYGFQLSARLASDVTRGQAGRFDLAQNGTAILCANGQYRTNFGNCSGTNPVEFIGHYFPSYSSTFEVDWMPPNSNLGAVKFYVAGLAANENAASSGDRTFTANALLTPVPGVPPVDGRATLTYPVPGTVLSSRSLLLTWSAGENATNYWLDVGNSIGKGDISAGATTSVTREVTGLPTDGRTLYVRLWTHANGAWQTPIDYTLTACSGCTAPGATLYSHTPGASTLAGPVDVFRWSPAGGATKYWLDVGTKAGSGDIHSGETPLEFKVVSNLPVDGRKVYIRIWSYINNTWAAPTDYAIDSCTSCVPRLASLQAPRQGITLTSTSVTFTWEFPTNVNYVNFRVGSEGGIANYADSVTTAKSLRVDNLPNDGRQIYVAVVPFLNGVPTDPSLYSFTACTGCTNTGPHILIPVPGSKLSTTSPEFRWTTATGATKYRIEVGNVLGSSDIAVAESALEQVIVNGFPADARRLFVRLSAFTNGVWGSPADYFYEACNACSTVTAALSAPTQGATFNSSSVTFTWSAAPGATNYWLDVGNSKGIGDISAGATAATSKQVSNIPADGRTIHARLWTFLNGAWQTPNDYTFTACSGCAEVRAQLTKPTSGTTFTTRTATFEWTASQNATQYWLDVGTVQGQGNIFGGAMTTLAKQVTNLPANGASIYVALWTFRNGAWQTPLTYTFTACNNCPTENRALLTAPAIGSTLTTGTMNFTWTNGTNATQYWLDVGNSLGSGDIAARNITTTATTVTVPRDGRTLFIRLWTFVNGAWQQPFDYTVKACNGC